MVSTISPLIIALYIIKYGNISKINISILRSKILLYV